MKENERAVLCLQPDVSIVQDDGGWGLRRGAEVHYAQDAEQAVILRRMAAQVYDLHALTLAVMREMHLHEAMASLAIAAFVLEFDQYLEA